MKQVTEKQLKLFNIIRDYIGQHGFAPTFAEMKTFMGDTSNQTISDKLTALETKGYIKRGYKARAIVILKEVDMDEWYEGAYGTVSWRTTDDKLANRLGQLGTFYKVKNMNPY